MPATAPRVELLGTLGRMGFMAPDSVDDVLARLAFNEEGLVPAIAQQWDTHEVLMMAWMDEAAVRETLETGRGVYYSRSRGERWAKGDTSGHVQHVHELRVDCDGDTVLLLVDQVGAACHTGDRSCFDAFRALPAGGQA
jgi:phosphoribosyl-AMP cyclohydrolase